MSRNRRLAIFLLFLTAGTLAAQDKVKAEPKPKSVSPVLKTSVPIQDPVLKEFETRLNAYMDIHKKADAALPKLKDKATPPQITAHKQQLASSIRQFRQNARQGDIFYPEILPMLQRTIRSEFKTRGGGATLTAIKEDKPAMKIEINKPYPEKLPMSTMPPMVLAKLPQLPEQLEYRFANKTLILIDNAAGIIIDYVPGVLP